MAAIAALTSAREMSAACSLPHRGSRYLRTSASACFQDLLLLLGVLLDVARGQFLERAFGAVGLTFGRRVLALGDLKHDPAGQLAGVGQTDGVGRAEAVPARAAVERIDDLPGSCGRSAAR